MTHNAPRRPQAGLRLGAIGAAIVCAAFAALPAKAQAQGQAQAVAPNGLPTVTTTRILAIGHLTPKATPRVMPAVMPDEVRETVRLYLAGKVADWYVRKDGPGVVFILNLTDVAEARALLEQLPLGRQGLMDFDLIPLGPLSPLGLLATPPN